ncbi:MAG: hypothetical protein ACKVHE_28675 [Planctomycetales bacterium]
MKFAQFTTESELSAIDGASAIKLPFPTVIRTGSWPLHEQQTDRANEDKYQRFLVADGISFVLRDNIDPVSRVISVTVRVHKSILIATIILLSVPALLSAWLWVTSGPAEPDLINHLLISVGVSLFGIVYGCVGCWRRARTIAIAAHTILASTAHK